MTKKIISEKCKKDAVKGNNRERREKTVSNRICCQVWDYESNACTMFHTRCATVREITSLLIYNSCIHIYISSKKLIRRAMLIDVSRIL